jgi:6-phosphofructokinase 1
MGFEKLVLEWYAERKKPLPTAVRRFRNPRYDNPCEEDEVGLYRGEDARRLVTANLDIIEKFGANGGVPSFLEAGPRRLLYYYPPAVRAAVVTAGGPAPGINAVVHSIVSRHWKTYGISNAARSLAYDLSRAARDCVHHLDSLAPAGVFGVYDGFYGLSRQPLEHHLLPLTPEVTERWLDSGGSELRAIRYPPGHERGPGSMSELAQACAKNLMDNWFDILYVIGGDGSMATAHEIAFEAPRTTVVGVPKTMDNDVPWIWESFGFTTAVEQATQVINMMHSEAQSTRRVGIVELFGAESGFVVAMAVLASGHIDLALIPEEFRYLSEDDCVKALDRYIGHVVETLLRRGSTHAVVVVAEGVEKVLAGKGVSIDKGGPHRNCAEVSHRSGWFVEGLEACMRERITDSAQARGGYVPEVFNNRPKHSVRAISPSAFDRTYCTRLGSLAVDNALAGYTDFMISQWMTEWVLVPLGLVTRWRGRGVPLGGMLWKHVLASTGQHARRSAGRAVDPCSNT